VRGLGLTAMCVLARSAQNPSAGRSAATVRSWQDRGSRSQGSADATSRCNPEDQILPRLAALAILQAESSSCLRGTKQAIVQVTSPAQAAELIDRLRTDDIRLSYDPATRTLRMDTKDALAVSIG
jgi:hypothetical protein